MATNYPGSVDSLPRPTSTTTMDEAGYEGDVVIDNISDAVEAIETELGVDPAGAQSTVVARLDYTQAFLVAAEVWPSGGWVSNAITNAAVSAQSCDANLQFYTPWFCPASVTLDRVGVRVETPQTGANARLALYGANSDGSPGSLVADFGEVDCSSQAYVALTISQAVTGGTLYWLSLLNETASVTYQTVGARVVAQTTETGSMIGRGMALETRTYTSGVVSTAAAWASLSFYTNAIAFKLRRT